MRILFCSHEPFWPLTGGGTIGNFKIVERFLKEGHEVIVATPLYADTRSIPIAGRERITFIPFSPFYIHHAVKARNLKYVIYSTLYVFHILRVSLTQNYDVVVLRNALLGFSGRLAGWIKKAPVCLSLTDVVTFFLYSDKSVPRWLARVFNALEIYFIKSADRVCVITPLMKEKLVRAGVRRDTITVTYDGVDTAHFDQARFSGVDRRALRCALGLDDRPIVIFHGTLDRHHNVRAIAGLLQDALLASKAQFLFIGCGESFDALAQMAAGPRIRFIPFVEHAKLPEHLALASAAIIPYERNPNTDLILTLKLLEYLAMGIPTVTYNHAGICGLFENKEFVKIARNREEFVANIDKALAAGLSSAAQELARTQFSWDAVTGAIHEQVKELYGRRVNSGASTHNPSL